MTISLKPLREQVIVLTGASSGIGLVTARVGFQAKLLAMVAGISPRLTDKLIEFWAFPSQQSDRPSRDREDNASGSKLLTRRQRAES